MTLNAERRLLQLAVAIACLVPLAAGGIGMIEGPGWLQGVPDTGISNDLDSHFRYISGIFFGVGLGFASCIARIESRGRRFRLLSALVICGGGARLLSLLTVGSPSTGHIFGLVMELIVVPLLMLWQMRIARLSSPIRTR